jgi:hypothetical protein
MSRHRSAKRMDARLDADLAVLNAATRRQKVEGPVV